MTILGWPLPKCKCQSVIYIAFQTPSSQLDIRVWFRHEVILNIFLLARELSHVQNLSLPMLGIFNASIPLFNGGKWNSHFRFEIDELDINHLRELIFNVSPSLFAIHVKSFLPFAPKIILGFTFSCLTNYYSLVLIYFTTLLFLIQYSGFYKYTIYNSSYRHSHCHYENKLLFLEL